MGSQSHQKRAFRFCLTKLPWHADVINDKRHAVFQTERRREWKEYLEKRVDIWIFDYSARLAGTVSQSLVENRALLSSVRHARRRLSIPENRIAGVDLGEGIQGLFESFGKKSSRIFCIMPTYWWSFETGFSWFSNLRAHVKTDMNHLDVASLTSAPTAVLFLAVTWEERTILFSCKDMEGEFWNRIFFFFYPFNLELQVNDIRPVSCCTSMMQN